MTVKIPGSSAKLTQNGGDVLKHLRVRDAAAELEGLAFRLGN